MVFDDFDLAGLPENSEEAFSEFEKGVRERFEEKSTTDRRQNSDHNGEYFGSYEPERSYVTAVLAFLDEYSLQTEIVDISELGNEEFNKEFGRFKSKIEYVTTRYALRKHRIQAGTIGTVIQISSSYKSEIGSHLEKIRKIINQEVADGAKKDKIFGKIASLQSEVDRDKTTVDAAFGRVLDLSKVLGEATGNLKPAIDQLERVKKIFWDRSEPAEQLPKPDRPKQIEKAETDSSFDMDDDIPF